MSQGAPSSDPASNNGEPHAVPEEKKVPDLHYSMNTDGILEWVDPLSDERRKFGKNLGTVVQTSDNDSGLPAEFSVPVHTVQEDSLPAHYEVLLNGPDASPTVMVPTASGVFETVDQIASNNIANTALAGNGPATSDVHFVPLLKSEFDEVRQSLHRAVEDMNEPLTRVALGMLIHDQISLARRQIAENPIQFDSVINDVFERVDREAYTLLSNLPVLIDDYSQIEGLLPAFLEVAAKHYDDEVKLVMKTEKKVSTSLGVFQKFLLNIIGTISKRFPVWIDKTALGNRINAFLSSNDLHRDDKPSFDSYCRHHREEAGRYKGAKILFMTYASLWESMMPSIADRKMMDWLFTRIEEAHRKLLEAIDSMDFKKKDKLKELWQQNLTYIRSSFDEALKDAKTVDLPLQRVSIASAAPSSVQLSAVSTKEKDYSLALTKSSIIAGCDIAFLEMERSIRQSIPDQKLAGEVIKELQAYLFGTVLPQLPEHINEMNFPSLEPLMDLALGVRPFLHAAGLAKYADRVQEKPDASSLQTFELMGRDTESAVAEACAMFLRPLLEVIDRKLEIETIELKDFLRIAARSFDAIGPHLDFNSVDSIERTIADKLRQPEIQNFVQLTRDIDRFLQLFLKDNLARIDPMVAAKLLDVYDAVHRVQIEEFSSLFPENGRKAMQVFSERQTDSAIELEGAFPKQEVVLKEAEVPKTQASPKEAQESLSSSISKGDLKVICDAVLEEVAEGLKRFYPNWKGNRDYESTLGIARTSVRDILAECPETLDRNSWNKMEHLVGSAFDFAPFLSGLYVSLSAQQKILDDDNTINVSSRGAELAFKESELVTHAFLVLLQNIRERLGIPTISADQLRNFFAETRLCKAHEAGSPAPSETRVKLSRFVSRMLAALPERIDHVMAQKIADVIARAEEVDADALGLMGDLAVLFRRNDQIRRDLQKHSLHHLFQSAVAEKASVPAERRESVPEVKSMPRAEFERLCHQMGDEIFAAVSSQFTLDPTVFDPYSIRRSVDLILKECPEVITQENYGKLFDFFNYSMPYGILLRKVGLPRNIQKRITPITDEDPDKRLLFCEVQFKQKTRAILRVVQEQCGVPTISKKVFKNTLGEFALTQPKKQMAKNLDRNVYKLADFIDLFLTDLPEELDRRTMTHFISVLYKSEIVGIDLIAGERDDLHAALKERLTEAEEKVLEQIDALLRPPQLREEAPSMTRGEFEALCTQIITDTFREVQSQMKSVPLSHPALIREFVGVFSRGCPEKISRDNVDALDRLHEGVLPYPQLLESAGVPKEMRAKILGVDMKPFHGGGEEVERAKILEETMSKASASILEQVIHRCGVPTIGKSDVHNALYSNFPLTYRPNGAPLDIDTTFHKLGYFVTSLLSSLPDRIDRKLLSRLLDVLTSTEDAAIDLLTEDPELRSEMRVKLQESKKKLLVQMDALLDRSGSNEAAPPVPRTDIEALVADINRRLADSARKLSKGQDSLAANNGLVQIILSHVLAECPQVVTAENFQHMVSLRYSICRIPVAFQDTGVSVEHQQAILGGDRAQIDYSTGKDLEIVPEMTAELGTLHRLLCDRLGVPTISAEQFRSAFHPILIGVKEAGTNEYYARLSQFASNVFAGLPERLDRHMVRDIVSAIRRADDLSKKFLPPGPDHLFEQLRQTEQTLRDFDDAVIETLFTGAASGTSVPSKAHEKPAEKTTEETFDPDTWSTDATLSREVSEDLGVALLSCPHLTRDLLKRKIGDIFSGIFAGDIDKRLGILTKAQRKTELQVVVPLRDAAQRVVSHVTESGPIQTSESYRMLIGGLGAIIKNCRGAHLRIALTECLAEAFNATLDGLESMVLEWQIKQGDGRNGNGGGEDEKKDGVVEESQPTLLTHKEILKVLADANEEASRVLGIKTVMRKDKSLEGIQSSTPVSIRSMNDLLVILYSTIGRSEYLQTYASSDAQRDEVHRVFERSMRKLAEKMPDAPDSSVNLLSLQYLDPLAPLATVHIGPEEFSLKSDEVFSEAAAARIARSIPGRVLPVALLAMKESMQRIRILLQNFARKLLPDGVRSSMEIQMLSEFLSSLIFRDNVSDATDKQFRQTVPRVERKTTMTEFSTRLLNRWNSMAHAMFDSVMNPPEPEKAESTPGETGIAEGSDDRASGPVPTSSVEDEITAADVGVIGSTDHEPETEKESVASGEVIEPTPEPEPIDPLAEAMHASGSTDPALHIGTLFDLSLSIHSERVFRSMVHQHSMKDTEEIAAEMERIVDVCHDAIAQAMREIMQPGFQPTVITLQVIAARAIDLVTTGVHENFVHTTSEQRDALIREVCESIGRPDIAAEELLILEGTPFQEVSSTPSAIPSETTDSPLLPAPVVEPRKKGVRSAADQFIAQRVRAEQRQQLDVVLKQLQIIETERPGLEDGLQKAFEELRARAAGGDMEASATVVNFHNMQQQFLQYFQLLLDSKQS